MKRDGKLPKVLCVDDEPQVLEGLGLHLRRRFHYFSATSGPEGLQVLAEHPDMAVVVSDMRMPGMDGATFLAEVRRFAPQAVRMLLTGQSAMESAIKAVNQGQIFRFLTKPCNPKDLLAHVESAVEQHRLLTAERELLEQTLQGAVQALIEVLGLASPAASGRALRLRRLAEQLAEAAGAATDWALPLAAMLSQLGVVTLPAEIHDRYLQGQELDAQERQLVERLPVVVEQLLAKIPRLEPVRSIIRHQNADYQPQPAPAGVPRGEDLPLGARILRLAGDYDLLESRGLEPAAAIDVLRQRRGCYDPRLLEHLARLKAVTTSTPGLREIPLEQVQAGMIFAQDVHSAGGTLLIARGSAASAGMLERIKNLPQQLRQKTVLVTAG